MRPDKTEARLKALLKDTQNRRCVNCDSLGPQYVVCNFNVFVCTVCSGVHRQFGHRVKGVSMSTFKPEEVAELEASGNEKFAAYFLSKWTTAALPKPVDRDVHRIHTWISAIYQDRRFYAEPTGGWAPGTGAMSAAGSSISEGREPAVRPMSDVLGSETPKLKVQGSANLERSVSAISSSAGAATPTRTATAASASHGAATAAAAGGGLNLLDVSSPKSARSVPASTPGAAAPAAAWDPFGEQAAAASGSPAAAAAAQPAQASPRPASAPAAEATWASFGDTPAPKPPPASALLPPAAPAAAAAGAAGSWEAFGDGLAASKPAASATAAAAGSSSPPKSQPMQPVRSTSRPEVPMDVFYPEFEQIRATGMLPTGQPVPLPAFPPSYGAPAGVAGRPAGANPYATYSYPAAQPGYGGYGAAPGVRPTIAIPPAPLHPGYGYGGASPAGRPGMPSPGYSASSGYSPAGSVVSPAGSGFSSGPPPVANGGGYGTFPGVPADHAAALRSSTGSLSELMPGTAAPTPAAHRLGDPDASDPFAGLAPGLRGALPAVPNGGSSKYGAAAPPPTPSGLPPFHSAAVPPASSPYGAVTAPFAAPPVPAAGMAPATAAATATLFGRTPSLTGYDMSAPAAPKPQASGNPFA